MKFTVTEKWMMPTPGRPRPRMFFVDAPLEAREGDIANAVHVNFPNVPAEWETFIERAHTVGWWRKRQVWGVLCAPVP